MNGIRWKRALLNGFLAWLLSWIVSFIPGLIYGTMRGFELGRQGAGPEMQATITADVGRLYQNWLLILVLVLLTGLIVFWRARLAARGTGQAGLQNGLIVGAVPAALTLVLALVAAFDPMTLVYMLVDLGAGASGGYMAAREAMVSPASAARSS